MRVPKTLGRLTGLLVVLLAMAGCSQGPSPETQARLDSLQAERDSLSLALSEQEANVQSLSSQIEDAFGVAGGTTGSGSAENLGDRIGMLREELTTARGQLEEAQGRIGALNRRAATLRDSVTVVTRRAEETTAAQRDSIQSLVASTESMESRIEDLNARRSSLEETVGELEDVAFTGYVAIGTKDELMSRGVIEEEGGARVLLLLWRAGETLVPARDLDAADFEAINTRQMTTLPLPAPGTYRVISRHDTQYLEPAPDSDGRFTGESLRITDPEAFWHYSPFLILVREE